jgi:hypothetical protein
MKTLERGRTMALIGPRVRAQDRSVVALPAAHVERPHAVGAHVAEGHRRSGLRSWSRAHAGEDIRASSATASSGRCALLRDTVPDQGEGRSAAGTGEGEAGSTPTGASCWPRRAGGFDLHHSEIILGVLVIALLILMVVEHWTLHSAN